jgi:thioredoxin 1
VIEITDDTYADEVFQSPELGLIYFYSPYAGTASLFEPILEEIANNYAGRVKVWKVSHDDYPYLGTLYGLSELDLPIAIVTKNGAEQARLVGPISKETISQLLDRQLARPASVPIAVPTLAAAVPVIEITAANYTAEVLQSPVPVLIHFYAPWVGPSRLLAPILEEIANDYAGRVKVGKINVDDAPYLEALFGPTELPTLLVIRNGTEQARLAGSISKAAITQMLDQQLGSHP